MKKTILLLLNILVVLVASAQFNTIRYSISTKTCFIPRDTIFFSARNLCKNVHYVLYSLEYKDSTGDWQEVDNDIYTIAHKGMKIITLNSTKRRDFQFGINSIDSYFLNSGKPVKFRIVENLYSKNKVEIVRTKAVKEFLINCK
jgi:hypothetical protein